MDSAAREVVRGRAGHRCEYCRLPQDACPVLTFHVDHIVAKQHVDQMLDDPELLCLACSRCNAYKGTNLSSIDPETNDLVPLYHPRNDNWDDHFLLRGGEIEGKTPIGRATVRLLHMNAPQRVELREQWILNHGNL